MTVATIETLRRGFPQTATERAALRVEARAPVTGAVVSGDVVVATYGDGAVRLFRPGLPPLTVAAHRGAILSVAADAAGAVTGGDDGRCLLVARDGSVATLAEHPGAWIDCVAAHPSGLRACSVGRCAHVWRPGASRPDALEHPSTVGGLAFDPKGLRLAVAHYGGATVWEAAARRWKPSRLSWKGSHVGATFSLDGKYLVTAMQEDALHGWRLRDRADMAMSGYPAKVKSFAWVGDAPWLATSGADSAVCWPFDGKDGPMGRPPEETCFGAKRLCSAVAGLVGEDIVIAGFRDGAVLAGRVGADGDAVVKGSGGAAVTALALTPEGWLLIGCEDGLTLWMRLGG
jgi:WD40 repeat protein